MKRIASISLIFSIILVTVDGVTVKNKAVANDSCTSVGRIASIQGKVDLKRPEWSDYQPIDVGTELCLGDLLRTATGAIVILQCADSTQETWTVPDGKISGAASGCPEPKEPIHRLGGPIVPPRSEIANRIPYIISPHETLRLDNKPKMRWMAVAGANIYTVRVVGVGVDWSQEVKTTEVIYSGEKPLISGESYLLTVEADNGEESAKATLIFDENKAQFIKAAAERLSRNNLTDEEKTLALAYLYIGQELIPDAIDLLESLAIKGSQTVEVYYTLGELYLEVELFEQAQNYYKKAEQLAATAKNLEGQALAAARLGELYTVQGDTTIAIDWLKKAQKLYQELGDIQQVNELEQMEIKIDQK